MPLLRELEGWFTTSQAAEAVGRSRQGVINLALDGRLRAVQVGAKHPTGRGAWIFDPASIEAFLRKREGAVIEDDRSSCDG